MIIWKFRRFIYEFFFLFQSIQSLLNYAGFKSQNQTQTDLLSTVNEVFKKRIIKGLKGIENIYTQHTPILREIIEDLARGRLKVNNFPYLTEDRSQGTEKPTDIIIFMVGGTTYEEALHVDALNRSLPGVRIILGSTCIHNLASFLDELSYTSSRTGFWALFSSSIYCINYLLKRILWLNNIVQSSRWF